jgi:hypothetical protein
MYMGVVRVDISRRPDEPVSYANSGGRFQWPFLAREGDGCVKDTRNPPRHRWRHPDVRGNYWEYRGCR